MVLGEFWQAGMVISGLPLDEQLESPRAVLSRDDVLTEVLARTATLGLPGWNVSAGCLFQAVGNVATDRPPTSGIKDHDVFYFDAADLFWEAEDAVTLSPHRCGHPPLGEEERGRTVHHPDVRLLGRPDRGHFGPLRLSTLANSTTPATPHGIAPCTAAYAGPTATPTPATPPSSPHNAESVSASAVRRASAGADAPSPQRPEHNPANLMRSQHEQVVGCCRGSGSWDSEKALTRGSLFIDGEPDVWTERPRIAASATATPR
ncbi:hypothetical protein GCM10018782_56430 [Streptomyces griseoaurantiacus]|nr:hypothetical protein GCM10018782_56430 [Streptomyces griseoaurantiacus]